MTIISFKHRFIFVKTRKTAGTSLEVHLAQSCGDADIITPIYPENDRHFPRNFLRGENHFFNHMPASLIRTFIPDDYPAFFSFCFERHPIDKCISHFAMLKNSKFHHHEGSPRSWDEYLERKDFPVDTSSYVDQDNKLMVDKIYKYEDITESLEEISSLLKIPYTPLLAKEKTGFRIGTPSFDEVLRNPAQRNIIFDAFSSSLVFTSYG